MYLYEKTVLTPPEEFVRVEWTSLKNYITDVFPTLGVPREHAEIVADVLVTASLMSIENHGVRASRDTRQALK
jgi:LDH2 family malate/lactate/ureidoglycolate dehydrogenase